MPEDDLTSFIDFDAYRYFSGQALLITSQSGSHSIFITNE